MKQPDLFGTTRAFVARSSQSDPDPNQIRTRLHAMLAQACGAHEMPWDPARARTQQNLFHNMANWLPEVERDELRLAFAAEMRRLSQPPGPSTDERVALRQQQAVDLNGS
jgi:hypothetical protein